MKWLLLTLAIAANALASVMVKMAVMPPRKFPSLSEPMGALGNWPFWLGLGLYGATFLLYAGALTSLPLNVAYPVLTSGAVAIVALLSVLVFNEQLYWTTFAGIVLVVVGVALTVSRSPEGDGKTWRTFTGRMDLLQRIGPWTNGLGERLLEFIRA